MKSILKLLWYKQTSNGYSKTGDRVYQNREAGNDEGLAYRGREQSKVQSDDFGSKGNGYQGSGGKLKDNTDTEEKEADGASFFCLKILKVRLAMKQWLINTPTGDIN